MSIRKLRSNLNWINWINLKRSIAKNEWTRRTLFWRWWNNKTDNFWRRALQNDYAHGHFKEHWLTLLIPGTILSAITVPEKQRWRTQEEVCVDVRRMDTQVMLTMCHHRVYIHPDVTHHSNVITKTLTTIEDRMEVGIGTYEGEAFLRIERMNGCVMKEWESRTLLSFINFEWCKYNILTVKIMRRLFYVILDWWSHTGSDSTAFDDVIISCGVVTTGAVKLPENFRSTFPARNISEVLRR